jgi:hypothetical protein
MLFTSVYAAREFPNGFGLVALRLIVAGQLELVTLDHGGRHSGQATAVLDRRL